MTVSCQLRIAEVREIMFPMNVATPVKKGMANAGRTTTPCTVKLRKAKCKASGGSEQLTKHNHIRNKTTAMTSKTNMMMTAI
jgi:hypothetical protein